MKYTKTSRPVEYEVWCGMRSRCRNVNHVGYPRYGGRGIRVDPRWDSFDQFFRDMGPRPDGKYTLERIDNDGPYAPGNCRWATHIEQGRNTSRSKTIAFGGEVLAVNEWSRRSGASANTIMRRFFKYGWSAERAIFGHEDKRLKNLTLHGETKSLREWGEALGLRPGTISVRLQRGATVEEALRPELSKPGPAKGHGGRPRRVARVA